MKQVDDTRTLELPAVPLPKRRGRPPTGDALTAAERQARRRAKLKEQGVMPLSVEVSTEAIEKLRKFLEFKDLTPGQVIDRLILNQLARKR